MAALKVFLFFLATITAYYIVTRFLFGIFPLSYFLVWIAVALLFAPLYAVLVWYGNQVNWIGV